MWDFMDLNTTMWQVKGEDAPLIQVEHMVDPRANLPVDVSFGAEEGKSTKGLTLLGGFLCSINHVEIRGNTKVLDVQGRGGDKG